MTYLCWLLTAVLYFRNSGRVSKLLKMWLSLLSLPSLWEWNGSSINPEWKNKMFWKQKNYQQLNYKQKYLLQIPLYLVLIGKWCWAWSSFLTSLPILFILLIILGCLWVIIACWQDHSYLTTGCEREFSALGAEWLDKTWLKGGQYWLLCPSQAMSE